VRQAFSAPLLHDVDVNATAKEMLMAVGARKVRYVAVLDRSDASIENGEAQELGFAKV
jgi:hypothetical protein